MAQDRAPTGKRGCSPRILSPSRKPEDGRIVDPPDRAFLHGRRRRISRPRKSTGPTFSRPGKSVAGDLWRERQRIHCSRMAARRGRGTGGSGGGISIYHKNFHRGRSLVWSVRAGWRRSCSLVWNALLFQSIKRSPLIRVGIHPPDWDHPRIRKQILQILGKALAARRPMTYEGWLTSIRDRP